jgi:TonB family protein
MKTKTNRKQMKKIYLVLIVLLPALTYGQNTIKKTEIHSNPNYKEIYYVLKSDKVTLNGSYTKLSSDDKVLEDGFYKNGAKDSIWRKYFWNGKILNTGKYVADKKVGIWECFTNDGKLELSFDYSTNKLVYYKINDKEKDKKFNVMKDGSIDKVKLDRPPLYIDGTEGLNHFIFLNLRYPAMAQESGISGKVEITFTIDSEGKTSNHRVTYGIGSGCDESALRAVKMIPDNWLPGVFEGNPVTVEYVLPIGFKILKGK